MRNYKSKRRIIDQKTQLSKTLEYGLLEEEYVIGLIEEEVLIQKTL